MALSYDNITEKYYEGETMQQNQWIVDEMNQVYKQGIHVGAYCGSARGFCRAIGTAIL